MSLIGTRIEDLDTPALLLDGPASERNIRKLADFFRGKPCQLRPHFKNHKCTALAHRQLAAGSAIGMTAAKLGEAEVLGDAGISDVLIANQVVGARKIERLVALAKRINVRVAFDHIDQVKAISDAAKRAGVTVGLLVEVDIGMGRCGVAAGEPTLELVRQIAAFPGVRFDGIQAYEGHAVYVNDREDRATRVRASMQKAIDTKALLERNGFATPIVSGGSSSTYAISGVMDGMKEIQAGTYATMDWRYQQMAPEFEIALSILTRVISRPKPGVAVLDIGVKGVGAEFGIPRIKDCPEVEIPFFGAEEHTVVKNTPDWRIGHPVHLLPSHACTTCNLHRQMIVHEGGKIVEVWPIEGSGKLA